MPQQIHVRFLPNLVTQDDIEGACVIMTDVLRASSTIVTALNNGAEMIVPRAEIDDSRDTAQSLGKDSLIGGERDGTIVPGFQLGNSPREYSGETVKGRPIVLCTTNGTWALEFCRGAKQVLIGSLLNLGEIVKQAANFEKVTVVCAGTRRRISGEDCLFAGGVVSGLVGGDHNEPKPSPAVTINDEARMACLEWETINTCFRGDVLRSIDARDEAVFEHLKTCLGSIGLLRLGYDMDIRYCSSVNLVPVVPELNQEEWQIRLMKNKTHSTK